MISVLCGRRSAVNALYATVTLAWHVENSMTEDQKWGIAGTRARILTRIAMFLDTAGKYGQMPGLCDAYTRILVELQGRWPDATPAALLSCVSRPRAGVDWHTLCNGLS